MKNPDNISRRIFIKSAGAAITTTAGLSLLSCTTDNSVESIEDEQRKMQVGGDNSGLPQHGSTTSNGALPKRMLGATGMEIAMLSFGGGSQFLKNRDGAWEPLLERAIELGVNYFDTASSYDISEERYGELLSPIRDRVYIATKFDARSEGPRNSDEMMQEVETSLKRLKTDYVDVLLLHDVNNNDSVSQIGNSVYKTMQSLKEQGIAKHIGFSSMSSAARSKSLINTLDFDVCLLAMNATTYGGYAETALPDARNKNMGILAMKVMRDVVGENGVTAQDLMHYALDQDGIASAVIGHYGQNILEENSGITMQFQPSRVPKRQWGALERRLRHVAGPHKLCWAQPRYEDVVRRA